MKPVDNNNTNPRILALEQTYKYQFSILALQKQSILNTSPTETP